MFAVWGSIFLALALCFARSDDFLMKAFQSAVIALVFCAPWGCVGVQVRGDGPHGEVIRGGPDTAPGVTEADLGLPFYPGSVAAPAWTGGDTWFKMDGMMTTSRATADPVHKVVEFYEGKIDSAKITGDDQRPTVAGELQNGAKVEVMVWARDGKTGFQINVTSQGS